MICIVKCVWQSTGGNDGWHTELQYPQLTATVSKGLTKCWSSGIHLVVSSEFWKSVIWGRSTHACMHFRWIVWANSPRKSLLWSTRFSNGTNSPSYTLLYCQNFLRVYETPSNKCIITKKITSRGAVSESAGKAIPWSWCYTRNPLSNYRSSPMGFRIVVGAIIILRVNPPKTSEAILGHVSDFLVNDLNWSVTCLKSSRKVGTCNFSRVLRIYVRVNDNI